MEELKLNIDILGTIDGYHDINGSDLRSRNVFPEVLMLYKQFTQERLLKHKTIDTHPLLVDTNSDIYKLLFGDTKEKSKHTKSQTITLYYKLVRLIDIIISIQTFDSGFLLNIPQYAILKETILSLSNSYVRSLESSKQYISTKRGRKEQQGKSKSELVRTLSRTRSYSDNESVGSNEFEPSAKRNIIESQYTDSQSTAPDDEIIIPEETDGLDELNTSFGDLSIDVEPEENLFCPGSKSTDNSLSVTTFMDLVNRFNDIKLVLSDNIDLIDILYSIGKDFITNNGSIMFFSRSNFCKIHDSIGFSIELTYEQKQLIFIVFYTYVFSKEFNDILKIVSCEIDRFCTITILPFINDRTQVITEDVLYRLQNYIDILDFNNEFKHDCDTFYTRFENGLVPITKYVQINFAKVNFSQFRQQIDNYFSTFYSTNIHITNTNPISLHVLRQIILSNFSIIFNVRLEEFNNDTMLLLRVPLYFLIKAVKEHQPDEVQIIWEKLLSVIINNNLLTPEIISRVKDLTFELLLQRCSLIQHNYTYPLLYFDDVSNVNKKEYKYPDAFVIINQDKNKIDGAFVSETNVIQALPVEPSSGIMKLQALQFTTDDTSFEFMDCVFRFDGNKIICSYCNDSIVIKIYTGNNVRNIINLLNKYVVTYFMTSTTILPGQRVFIYINQMEIIVNENVPDQYSIIVFLIMGAKRLGDWLQVEISKRNYMLLRTIDTYCKHYSILSGGPIIKLIDTELVVFNWKPQYTPPDYGFIRQHMVTYDTGSKQTQQISEPKKIKLNLGQRIEIPLDRTFFSKYIKYKTKYLKLKNKLNKTK